MATIINVLGDTIKIDKAFVSGKDRVAVNDQVVFVGKLDSEPPPRFSAGKREYTVETYIVSSLTNATAIYVDIYENGNLVHSGIYDQAGNQVKHPGQASRIGAIQACASVGAALGVFTMLILNMKTGVVPGGMIGGAIGGGGGALLGYGLGHLLFGSKEP
jgi:hypothetical protein